MARLSPSIELRGTFHAGCTGNACPGGSVRSGRRAPGSTASTMVSSRQAEMFPRLSSGSSWGVARSVARGWLHVRCGARITEREAEEQARTSLKKSRFLTPLRLTLYSLPVKPGSNNRGVHQSEVVRSTRWRWPDHRYVLRRERQDTARAQFESSSPERRNSSLSRQALRPAMKSRWLSSSSLAI
jgi:hypothetical protein